MLSKFFKTVSTTMVSVFSVALAMSTGIYSFGIAPYIHDYFNTRATEIVATEDGEQDTQYFKSDYATVNDMMEAKFAHIRKAVGEGTVLLKNNNKALPLSTQTNGRKTRVTMLGNASAHLAYSLDAGAGQIANANDVCKHFDEALRDGGFDVNQTMYDFYANSGVDQSNPAGYYGLVGDLIIGEVDPATFTNSVKDSIKEYNDVGIIVLKRNVGEGFDLWTGEDDQPIYQSGNGNKGIGTPIYGQSALELTPYELQTIELAKNAGFDKLILVLNSDHQIALNGLENDNGIDAVLQVGGMGYNGVDGLVDVLKGDVNPSGKLITAWSSNSLSSPAAQDLGSTAYLNSAEIETYFNKNEAGYEIGPSNPFRAIWYIAQKESIYVGYRYYETRYEDVVLGNGNAESKIGTFASTGNWNYDEEMAYTFGYGLSYSEFTQEYVGNPVWDAQDKTYTFKVKVTNVGDVAGRNVVQIYAQTPYTQTDIDRACEKSAIQLVNFGKTKLLAAGESETLEIVCDMHNIVSWDSLANGGEGGYILSEGNHYFALGNGAHDALNNVLAQKSLDGFNVNESKMDALGNADKVWSFKQGERDEETYSVSRYTGEEITNQFADADINYWLPEGEKVTYLTRNDYNTFPIAVDGEGNGRTSKQLTATPEMLLEMIGQTSVNGKDYSYGSLDEETKTVKNNANTSYQLSMMMGREYDDENWDLILDQLDITEMANLVGAGNGFTAACESITYGGSKDSDGPIGWYSSACAFDYTGDKWYNGYKGNGYGLPSRIYESTVVCAASFDRELEYERGELLGNEAIWLGRTGMWGISAANLARTAFSGRNGEYLGEEPMIAGYMGAAVSQGYSSKGGVAYTKHFAFNDQETNRYGMCTFMTEQEARELSLRCFEGILANEDGKTKSLGAMQSFSRIGCTWAGQSYQLMTQVLRNEWGFKGCVITDMAVPLLTYYHAPEAVKAGTDFFDTTSTALYAEVFFTPEKLAEDPVLHAALRQAAHRMLYVYVNSNAMNGVPVNAKIVDVTVWWEKAIVGIDIGLGVLALGSLIGYGVVTLKNRKEEI